MEVSVELPYKIGYNEINNLDPALYVKHLSTVGYGFRLCLDKEEIGSAEVLPYL